MSGPILVRFLRLFTVLDKLCVQEMGSTRSDAANNPIRLAEPKMKCGRRVVCGCMQGNAVGVLCVGVCSEMR